MKTDRASGPHSTRESVICREDWVRVNQEDLISIEEIRLIAGGYCSSENLVIKRSASSHLNCSC